MDKNAITNCRVGNLDEKLQSVDSQYNSLFKNNHSIMLLINPETGAIIDANPAACNFYGYSYKDIINMNIYQINTLTKEEVLTELKIAKSENRKHFFFNHRLSNGEVRNVEVNSGPITVKDKQFLYSIVHDITERKKAEEEIINLNKNLDNKVIERTRQLEEVNLMLEEANSSLEEVNAILEEEIAERMRIENSLNKSMLEIKDLYENAPCGYHSLDQNGVIIRINDTELKWLGYTREEIIGKKKLTDLLTADSQEVFEKNFPDYIKYGFVTDVEFTIIRKDGTRFPVLVSGTVIKDENGKYLMSRSTVYDISRRKQAEDKLLQLNNELEKIVAERTYDLEETNALLEETNAELEETNAVLEETNVVMDETNAVLEEEIAERIRAEEQYRLSEENLKKAQKVAHLGSWVWDNDIFEWSEGMYHIFGIEKNSFTGKLEDVIINAVHPEDLHIVTTLDIKHLMESKLLEYRIIWPDQSIRYIWNKIGDTVFDDSGKLIFFTGITQDITERKIIEDARAQAEAASEAKSTFLANMSHEIRTPINAIIGFNYLIQKTQLTDTQRDYVEKTILSAKNLLGLVNDVLDFSKIEANKIALEYHIFDLYEVLNSVSNIVSIDLYEKKLKLYYSIDPCIPQFLKGDAFRLNQVLLNLINNSIKFTEQGEIVITLEIANKNEGYILLRFTVEDTGIGMSQEQQRKLFHAFSQVDMSTTRKHGGTGLGLSISKSLIELMGGTIQVKSDLGQGCQFAFTAEFEWNEAFKVDEHIYSKLKFLKILLVCDNSNMVSIIRTEFEQFDIKINFVKDMAKAIQVFREKEDYDLVLIDWKLLKGEGKQAVIRIREAIGAPTPLLMLVSACKDHELEITGYDNNVNGIFDYPMGKVQLYNKLIRIFNDNLEKELSNETYKDDNFNTLNNTKILLVEDNEINQELAKAILEEYGLDIDIAENGSMALEMILQDRYDLVLMDLQMPVMDGYEAARRIRAIDAFRELPIIAMSAHAIKGIEEKVSMAGMNDYITKPFEVSKMIGTLKEWVHSLRF